MTLKTYVDDINDIDEGHRDLYKEAADGRFRLDADFEDVAPLKNALQRQKDKANSLSEKLKPLERYSSLVDTDFDPDSLEELMAKAASNGSPEEIEKLQREYDKKLRAKDDELNNTRSESESAKKTLKSLIVSQEVKSAALSAGVLKSSVDDIALLTRSNFGLDDNGKVQVLDEDGDPMGITPTEFFSKVYKDKKPHYYEASNATGSGAPHSSNKGGGSVKSFGEAKSLKDKVAAISTKIGN